LIDKKVRFLSLLYTRMGEQKIDVVIENKNNQLFAKEALRKGILLCSR